MRSFRPNKNPRYSVLLVTAVAAILLLALVPVAFAATYHVDTTLGKDTNDGLSEVTAWKTIAKVNAARFIPGDQILLKRGETWRETLTVSSSGNAGSVITFGAYGTGADPIISGSDLVAAGWTKDSTFIWKASVTTRPNIVYFNGIRGTQVAAKTNITGEFDWCWASNILYVWSPNGDDPGGHYTTPGIEAGARNRALQTNNQSYLTFNGLILRDGNAISDNTVNVGSTSVTSIAFQYCTIEGGVASGIELKGSATADSVTINNCTIQNNGNWGILSDYQYITAAISNSIITGNGWGSVVDNNEYSGIEGLLGNFNIFRNTIYGNAPGGCKSGGSLGHYCHGIYVHASTVAPNMYSNVIHDHAYGDGIKLRGSANVYRNSIYNNAGSGIECGGNGSTNVVYSIYQNIIYGNNSDGQNQGVVEQAKGAGTISMTVENNTIYQNGKTTQQELKIVDNVTALTVKNNLFYATPTRRTVSVANQTGTVAIDYNLHWRADGNPNLSYGGAGKTWTQWQALGYDAHGVNLNPLLVNPTSDFHLQSSSPAIGAGANVGLMQDYAGTTVPQGSAPDIGAYERSSSLPAAPCNIRIVPN